MHRQALFGLADFFAQGGPPPRQLNATALSLRMLMHPRPAPAARGAGAEAAAVQRRKIG